MIRDDLKSIILNIILDMGFSGDTNFVVEHPADITNGDFSTNVAMVLAGSLGQNPRDIANEIAEKIKNVGDKRIAEVSIAGVGFINIVLSKDFFFGEIARILEEEHNYGKSIINEGKRVLIEHSSPNIFKPFHIGHFMNNTIGESVKRLMEYSGADVTTISYPSDISLGIAKALFILQKKGDEILDDKNTTLAEKVSFLGDCYKEGVSWFDENENDQKTIKEIAEILYQKKEGEIFDLYKKARDLNLEYFKSITTRLGSHFDNYIFESEAGVVGKKLVEENIGEIFKESDGAIIYKGEDRGLHTRVFINKENNPTYEAKDLGLLSIKFSRFSPDISIFVTDYEQGPYFEVVSDAGSQIVEEWKEKTIHLKHGRLLFKGNKMSSRLGGVPLIEDLIDTVIDEVKEKSENNDDGVNEKIALGSLKFAILRSEAGKNANFDPETSLSFEGDSGPYLQYTYARLNSLLEKGKSDGFTLYQESPHGDIYEVHRLLYRFSEVVDTAIKQYSPHTITMYLISLAHAFNSFYGAVKIIDEGNRDETNERMLLVASVKQIIHSGLYLLGIHAPEKM